MRRLPALAVTLALLGASATAAAQDNTSFAQQRFVRGSALYDGRDYAHALEEFRGSLSLYESPNARLYAARCLRELGRLDEAVPEFERAAREASDRVQTDPRYGATRDAAQAELRAVEARVGHLTLTVAEAPAATRVRIAGRDIPIAALGVAIPVMPGQVDVVIEAEGFLPERREVEVAAGQDQTLAVPLRRRPGIEGHTERPWVRLPGTGPATGARPSRGVPRAAAFAAWGVGGAGLIAFGVFAVLANGRFQDLNTRCMAMPCDPSQHDAIAGGRTFQTVANVSLGVGLAGAAAGTLLFLLGHPAAEARPAPGVQVGLGTAGLTASGVF